MTLGDKIRKYRLLHNKTQKQLGEEVGFKKSTADVRINQYETGKMAPKADIRLKIAEALDVDIEALSDTSITSLEDIMYILFELEEQLGMDVERKEGRTCLSFDNNNERIRALITYLNLWIDQKASLLPEGDDSTKEQKRNYSLWKSKFVSNTKEYFSSKDKELSQHYEPLMENIIDTHDFAKTTSDITILIRRIIESGLSITTTFADNGNITGPGFTFIANELLDPPSPDAEMLFTRFLCETEHFKQLGAQTHTDMQMTGKELTVTYYISVASFNVIKSQIDDLLEHLSLANDPNDYSRDSFESMFKDSLETYCLDIEEEIKMASK